MEQRLARDSGLIDSAKLEASGAGLCPGDHALDECALAITLGFSLAQLGGAGEELIELRVRALYEDRQADLVRDRSEGLRDVAPKDIAQGADEEPEVNQAYRPREVEEEVGQEEEGDAKAGDEQDPTEGVALDMAYEERPQALKQLVKGRCRYGRQWRLCFSAGR